MRPAHTEPAANNNDDKRTKAWVGSASHAQTEAKRIPPPLQHRWRMAKRWCFGAAHHQFFQRNEPRQRHQASGVMPRV